MVLAMACWLIGSCHYLNQCWLTIIHTFTNVNNRIIMIKFHSQFENFHSRKYIWKYHMPLRLRINRFNHSRRKKMQICRHLLNQTTPDAAKIHSRLPTWFCVIHRHQHNNDFPDGIICSMYHALILLVSADDFLKRIYLWRRRPVCITDSLTVTRGIRLTGQHCLKSW